jgi:glycosyltransferase involved in cell wall biosynthesis
MKVLHLFGDWKWTGPAEPTLDLCLNLRALGIETLLACKPEEPGASNSLPRKALDRGLTPLFDLAFNKKLNIRDNLADIGRVRDLCDREQIDLVHVHFFHDHIIGALGARKARRPVKVVRTNQKAIPTPSNLFSRWLMRRMDGYLTYSQEALAADTNRFKLTKAWRIEPALHLERFDPARVTADLRPRFNLDPDAFVLGVVARMQRHRRFDILLEGVKRALDRVPRLRVLVVGRGTHMDEVAVQPAKRLGLEQVVTFTGYLADAYVDTLALFDALLFLVPGSDGTCRALREAMAMGKPVIGARRGMIPELVDDGRTGLVIDDSPENIASAIAKLAADRPAARSMGTVGREKALRTWDLRKQAEQVATAYRKVLETPATSSSS